MALAISSSRVPVTQNKKSPMNVQEKCFIAISCIMALGLVLSYALAAPWYTPLLFFTAGLIPIFPIWRVTNTDQAVETSILK